jgi:hypothetical protein
MDHMTDNPHDYFPRFQPDRDGRYPPRSKAPPIEPGQDFQTLTEKHGRPHGPFDKDRKLPYNGGK